MSERLLFHYIEPEPMFVGLGGLAMSENGGGSEASKPHINLAVARKFLQEAQPGLPTGSDDEVMSIAQKLPGLVVELGASVRVKTRFNASLASQRLSLKLAGKSQQEIARQTGGTESSVRAQNQTVARYLRTKLTPEEVSKGELNHSLDKQPAKPKSDRQSVESSPKNSEAEAVALKQFTEQLLVAKLPGADQEVIDERVEKFYYENIGGPLARRLSAEELSLLGRLAPAAIVELAERFKGNVKQAIPKKAMILGYWLAGYEVKQTAELVGNPEQAVISAVQTLSRQVHKSIDRSALAAALNSVHTTARKHKRPLARKFKVAEVKSLAESIERDIEPDEITNGVREDGTPIVWKRYILSPAKNTVSEKKSDISDSQRSNLGY